eukprot:scaffold231464_cov32-Tisochrysis_lutea.AAC.5
MLERHCRGQAERRAGNLRVMVRVPVDLAAAAVAACGRVVDLCLSRWRDGRYGSVTLPHMSVVHTLVEPRGRERAHFAGVRRRLGLRPAVALSDTHLCKMCAEGLLVERVPCPAEAEQRGRAVEESV